MLFPALLFTYKYRTGMAGLLITPPSSGSFSEPVSPLAGPERYPAAIASLAPPARIAACDAGVLPLSLNPHFAKRFADGEFNRGDGIAVLFLSRRK